MREQVNDELSAEVRPKSGHLDEAGPSWSARAAAAGRPDLLPPAQVLHLQRAAGNSGVTALLEGDPETHDDPGGPDGSAPSPVHDVINSAGRPLDPDVRVDMEHRLGHDFSDVRVHDDARAAASASAVNAHAYTVGSKIVFQRDQYDPASGAGRTTLAHELTHVVQQRSGPVEGTSAPGGIRISDPSDRFETEAAANAERVMATPAPAGETTGATGSVAGPAVQRDEVSEVPPEEEMVQGSFVSGSPVQREAEDAEEAPPAE